MNVKMTAERRTGRLLGVNNPVGQEGSAKRIDTAATALWNQMTVEEMTALDLAYAPPFAPVWDPILVAARQAAGAVRQAAMAGDDAPFIREVSQLPWTGTPDEARESGIHLGAVPLAPSPTP